MRQCVLCNVICKYLVCHEHENHHKVKEFKKCIRITMTSLNLNPITKQGHEINAKKINKTLIIIHTD